jgi:hypothetical protein
MQDVMASGSADPLVAEVAQRNAAIPVAIEGYASAREGPWHREPALPRRLHLLQFRYTAVQAVHRVREAYSLI